MTALVLLALAVPILGAVVLVVAPLPPARVVPVAASLGAAAWVGVAIAEQPVTAGRLEVDAVVAAAFAAALVLLAIEPPPTMVSSAVVLSLFTLAAVGAADTSDTRLLLAGALVALAGPLLLAARGATPRPPIVSIVAAVVGVAGAVCGAFGLGNDVATTAAGLGGAALLVLAGPALRSTHLVPVALLVVVRGGAGDPEAVAVTGIVVGAAVAWTLGARLVLARRHEERPDVLGAAAVGAALVLATVDLAGADSAALLVASGGVLVIAARHPGAVVALLPGIVATIAALAPSGEPRHAAASVVVVLLVLVAVVSHGADEATWALGPAVVFGLVPVWGWAGAALPAYREGLAVAATAALVAATLRVLPVVRAAAAAPATAVAAGDTGSITRRRVSRSADTHGTHEQEEDPVEER